MGSKMPSERLLVESIKAQSETIASLRDEVRQLKFQLEERGVAMLGADERVRSLYVPVVEKYRIALKEIVALQDQAPSRRPIEIAATALNSRRGVT